MGRTCFFSVDNPDPPDHPSYFLQVISFMHMQPVLKLTVGPPKMHIIKFIFIARKMIICTTVCTNMYHMCCYGDVEKLALLMLVVEQLQVEVVDQQMAVSECDIIKEIRTYKDITMHKLYMYL